MKGKHQINLKYYCFIQEYSYSYSKVLVFTARHCQVRSIKIYLTRSAVTFIIQSSWIFNGRCVNVNVLPLRLHWIELHHISLHAATNKKKACECHTSLLWVFVCRLGQMHSEAVQTWLESSKFMKSWREKVSSSPWQTWTLFRQSTRHREYDRHVLQHILLCFFSLWNPSSSHAKCITLTLTVFHF